MFAPPDLARRIEAAEAGLLTALARHATAAAVTGAPLVEAIDGGAAVFVRPGAPMNKLVGIGFDGPLDAARLATIEAAFAARSAPLQVELATLARCEAAQQFAARGYRLVAFENVLGCDPRQFVPRPTPHRVEPATGPAADWVETMADSFLAADGTGAGTADAFARTEVVAAMGELAAVPTLRRYAVRDAGTMLGGASLHLHGRTAQLCGAATAPPFRRRGVQAALLAARLRDAAAAGCDVAVMTAQPGSLSQHNAQRQGFALLYARAILVKDPG
ncbi:MAG: GNAT family N-acetyltransferase [Planctomycetes bacterium]|nr:GNAT family N-acetyltransferase [Planctomycetota bacterium]